jgi:hypothetical protein
LISINLLKNTLENHKNKFIWISFIIIGVFTIRQPAIFVGPDLDASGLIALVWFRVNNFQISQDIVTHVGPLSYLMMPVYVESSLWIQALFESVYVHFLFVGSIALLVTKLRVNWKDIVIILAITIGLSYLITSSAKIDEQIIFSAIIFLYLIITNKIKNKYANALLIILGLILAIESLIKFNLSIASIGLIITYNIISISKIELKKPIILSSSYVLCLILLWVLAEQNIENFPSYFVDGFMVSSGYSYAMAIDGPIQELIAGIVAISFIAILFSFSVAKKYRNLIIFILLNAILLFISFKHGFVRHDGHIRYFYFTYGVFFIITYVIYKYDILNTVKNKKRIIFLIVLLLGSIFCVVLLDSIRPQFVVHNSDSVAQWNEVPSLIFDKSHQAERSEKHIQNLKSHLPLDTEIIEQIGDKPMDIFPYDIMIPWIYDFNWSPRPMPWSFQVFNSDIGELNANHFTNENKSPKEILYAFKSIDNRYPIYDEPLTFQALLKNYEYTNSSNNFVLLSHHPKEDLGKKENLGMVEVNIGDSIKIPKYEKGYLFANVDLKFNSLGKLMYTAYKPAQAHIVFKFSDSTYSKEFRFIPDISNQGIFLSQYISNLEDIKSIFSDELTPNIDEIIIWVDDESHYENEIKIEFFGIPAKILLKEVKPKVPIDWDKLEKLNDGGSSYVDYIGNKLYAIQNDNIKIRESERKIVGISGWAVDGLSKDGTVNTFIVLSKDGNEKILTTQKVERPDVAAVFGIENYEKSGWSTAIVPNEFEEGCYSFSLRIPRTTGFEFFEIEMDKNICFEK